MTVTVDATGISVDHFETIQADLRADIRGELGDDLDLSPDQPLGQVTDIMAANLAEGNEALLYLHGSMNEATAEGVFLENIAALTGVSRLPATYGFVTLSCSLVAGTTLNPGTTAAVAGQPANQWQIVTPYTAPSTGVFQLLFKATQTGNIPATAGTITAIATPVSGWTSVTNPLDAQAGNDLEKDAELRVRRRTELEKPGSSTVRAIRADLRDLTGMVYVQVLENTTLFPVATTPAKGVEAIIYDGTAPAVSDDVIAQTIFDGKAGGIEAGGTTSGAVTDELGQLTSCKFTRVSQRPAYITIFVVRGEGYPVDGSTQIRAAIAAMNAGLAPGATLYKNAIESKAFSVPGVIDTPTCYLDFFPGPSATANLAATIREKITLDTTRVNVVEI